MKRLVQFLRDYKLFALAILTVIIGIALELSNQHTAAHWLLSAVALVETVPLLWDMLQDVRNGRYGIDILAATAIITSVILGQYWAAIVIVLMLTGGESLEDFAEHRAKSELDALLSHAPQTANVVRKGKTIAVAVSELRVGEKIFIKPGELVPVDAVITDGQANFDEASLTGESLPQHKQVDDQLLSGSINLDGAVTAKAVASSEESQYQQIIKLVRGAAASQAPFVRLADRYSLPFTFTAYAIAVAAWVVGGSAIRFLEVIVVATPCPLLLAAPIALISGMARASRYGIIVKTGGALERLAEVQTVAFDKTGTVTRGALSVESINALNSFKDVEVLSLAAGLEQSSNHILARAIVEAAQNQGVKITKVKHVKEFSGRGLMATLKGKSIIVGRLSLLEEQGVEVSPALKKSKLTGTVVYVGVDDKLAGVINLKDEVRSEAGTTLEKLRSLGVRHTMIVTGDNAAAAAQIAKPLGISEVHADMLPADKLRLIEHAEHRPLAFVGDGVNDAPVLTGADIGIALGARGSTAASESADMVIMLDDLGRVAAATAIAKRTFQIARQSILIGIGMSLVLMLVFATGKFSPLAGALLQEVIDVFVIFNALRAHLIKVDLS
jgi:heavy metal translocating P-type ATPase